MKKGFTIIELIVTIVIIAIVGGIGVVAYNNIFDASSKNYYQTVEQSLLLSGSEYFEKNRDELPIKGYNVVTLDNLEDGNYVSPVKDKKGGTCESGEVYVTRNPNTRQYDYEVCLKCLDYESEGAFCKGYVPGSINVNAYLEKDNNHKYNPLLSYKNVEVTKDNVIVELYLDDSNLSYYSIDKVKDKCEAPDKKCNVKIENSGSYLVSAHSADGVKIADDRIINIKIDKEAPTFDIINDKRYVIIDGTNKKDITIKIDNVKDDMGIKKISYCIKLENETCEDIDFNNLTDNTYLINENLVSGSYHIEVKVEDVAQNVTTKSSSFDVSYYVTLEYEDGKTNNFEVIKGKEYGYLDLLPSSYNNKIIAWVHKGTSDIVHNDTEVEKTSTHILSQIPATKIDIPTSSYCEDVKYNGENQKLTKNDPARVTFYNNTGTEVNTYTVKAKIQEGLVWSDGTTTDKEFSCEIKKAEAILTCSDKDYTGSEQIGCSCSGGTIGGTYKATNAGTYTASCTGDANHVNPENETWSMKKKVLTITAKDQTINYGKSITQGVGQVTASGLVSGDSLTAVTLTQSTTNYTTNGTITPSAANTTKGIENYSVIYNKGVLKINKVEAILTCSDKDYNGKEQIGCSCSGGTVGGTYKATNAGTYTASCTGDANHTNPSNKSWKINNNKPAAVLTCDNQIYTGENITGCTCTGGTCNNCVKKDVGLYTASCTPDSSHSAPANVNWRIRKQPTISFVRKYLYCHYYYYQTFYYDVDSKHCRDLNEKTDNYISDKTTDVSKYNYTEPNIGFIAYGQTREFYVKANVAGTFTVTSENTNVVTVDPSSQTMTANANEKKLVKLNGVGTSNEVKITVNFVPNDNVTYASRNKNFTARVFRWVSLGSSWSLTAPNGNDDNRCTAAVQQVHPANWRDYGYYYDGSKTPTSYTIGHGSISTCWCPSPYTSGGC